MTRTLATVAGALRAGAGPDPVHPRHGQAGGPAGRGRPHRCALRSRPIAAINRRRGRAEIFSRLVREGRTLRELILAAQDTGHWSVAGTPEQLADAVQERFEAGVLDVLSLNGLADDQQHDFAVNGLLAELRRRGVVKPGYRGATLRENLGLTLR